MSSFLEQIEKMKLPKVPALQVPEAVLTAAESLGLTVLVTSTSAPEQYELTQSGDASGYVRARWGTVSITYPDAGDDVLYEGPVSGFGGFEEHEREAKLLFALDLIATRILRT